MALTFGTKMTNVKKEVSNSNFLRFTVGNQNFAVPLLCVKEVIAAPEITRVPKSLPHFLGVTNLRGQIISVIDFRIKLSIEPNSHSEKTVIICHLDSFSNIGIMVDSVDAVIHPKSDEISPAPHIQSDTSNDYIIGVYRNEAKLVLMINIEKMLGESDLNEIKGQITNITNDAKVAA